MNAVGHATQPYALPREQTCGWTKLIRAMLTAFTARPLIELKQRDKSKVESILTYGNRLLVGLSTGTLRVYRINEEEVREHRSDPTSTGERPSSPARQQPVAELLREIEKFARRAIEQLAVIKEANLLVCLSDGYVSTHDLQHENYQQLEQLSQTKGASTFAVTSNIVKDASSGVPSIVSRLAVAVKRKLLLWSWQDTELSTRAVEVTLTAAARTLTWASATTLVCGLNSGYVTLDVESQEVFNILGSGNVGGPSGHDEGRFGALGATGMGYVGMGNWVPKPLATPLIDGELLLAKDVNTLFVDKDGKALDRRQIQWTTAPDVIAFSYPYLLALQGPPKGILEVRNPRTLSRLQSIPMYNASRVHVPQPSVSLAHAGKGFLVASGRCIWRMTAESYESQIQQLLDKGLLDEAISLIEMLEDPLLDHKEQRLREIKMQKAEALFHARKFRASLDLFTDVSAPPERVIKLFPSTIAGDLAATRAPTGDRPGPTPTAIDEKRTEQRQQPAGPTPDVDHSDRPSEAARSRVESKARSDGTSNRSMRGEDSVDGHLAGNVSSNLEKPSSDTGLSGYADPPVLVDDAEISVDGKDLGAAILELYSFLADTRRRLQVLLEPDGTLKPSAQINGDERDGSVKATLQTFLDRLDSPPEETTDVGELLRNIAKLVDTTLFRAYMIERPARAGSLFRIPNFCDPDVVQEKLLETGRYEDLVDFLHGKRLHRQALELLKRFGQASDDDEAPAALRGPRRTVAYLQNLPPDQIDLILEFARWPLQEEPALGMEVFVADTENADNLPREEILGYLEQVHPAFAMHYLEHIILELNDLTPDFHQRLINLYLDRLMQSKRAGPPDQHGSEGQLNRVPLTDRLLSFLKGSSQYSTGRTYNQIPRDGGWWASLAWQI